jgi:hypothetical protein
MSVADLIGFGRDVGTRFALVGLVPGGVLALFVLVLLWSGAPGEAPAPDRVLDHARDVDGWEVGLLFVAVAVAALLLQPLQVGLVRLLEGYWPAWAAPLTAWGRRRQRDRFDALTTAAAPRPQPPSPDELIAMGAAEAQLRRAFPPDPSVLLPTRLGNVLRAAESRAGEPYGLDAVVAWPRLYPLLPEPVRAIVDDQRDGLDLAARFCAVFAAAAAVSAGLLVASGWWLLVPAAWVTLAFLSYRGAITAAVAYGEGIRAAIDLHRFDLLTALHLPLPATLEQERAINEQLSLFLRQTWPVDFVYAHGDVERERADA